jgi:hypothetical protein
MKGLPVAFCLLVAGVLCLVAGRATHLRADDCPNQEKQYDRCPVVEFGWFDTNTTGCFVWNNNSVACNGDSGYWVDKRLNYWDCQPAALFANTACVPATINQNEPEPPIILEDVCATKQKCTYDMQSMSCVDFGSPDVRSRYYNVTVQCATSQGG